MDLAITHWKDKRDVFMITTCIPDSKTVVQKRRVETTLPTVIHTSNNMMGGVDRSHQMATSYPTKHKRIKKWYKKHFMYLIKISSFNAHIIHKKKGGELDVLNFRTKSAEQIVEKYGTVLKSSVERRGGRPSLEGNAFRPTERHLLILIPPTDKKGRPTRRFIVCHKHEQRKESRYLCRQYNEPFCVVTCVERYRTMKQY